MKHPSAKHLVIGDQVDFSESSVRASGVVIEDMGPSTSGFNGSIADLRLRTVDMLSHCGAGLSNW
jgi:hypothetical protein